MYMKRQHAVIHLAKGLSVPPKVPPFLRSFVPSFPYTCGTRVPITVPLNTLNTHPAHQNLKFEKATPPKITKKKNSSCLLALPTGQKTH
jgi:hypothetical protein